jgi:hypothetical protein
MLQIKLRSRGCILYSYTIDVVEDTVEAQWIYTIYRSMTNDDQRIQIHYSRYCRGGYSEQRIPTPEYCTGCPGTLKYKDYSWPEP